jgi:hypothetical protein
VRRRRRTTTTTTTTTKMKLHAKVVRIRETNALNVTDTTRK